MSKDEDFIADDGISTVPAPKKPEGGDKQFKPATEVEMEDVDMDDEDEDEALDEALNSLFAGENISEAFKSKAQLLFKAAVSEATKKKLAESYAEASLDINLAKAEAMEEIERLREELETSIANKEKELSESTQVYETALVSKLDDYMDVVVERWLEENRIAVESGIRVQMAETFMSGLRDMFYEHNVEISEEKVDIISDLEAQNEKLQEQIARSMEDLIENRKQTKALQAKIAFAELSEGLTDIERDRLASLTENVSVDNLAKYKEDVKTIRESFIESKPKAEGFNDSFLKETFEDKQPQPKTTKNVDDVVAAYAKGIEGLRFR